MDLRDYKESDIRLDYRMVDSDLLIPLHKCDYIIYQPNKEVDEYPIFGTGLDGGNKGSVEIGLILYYEKGQSIDLSNLEFHYYLHKQLKQDILFTITFACSVIWLISVIVFVAVELKLLKCVSV